MPGPTHWDLGALGSAEHASIPIDHEGDHRGILIRRMPGYLRNKTRVQALLRSLGGGLQDAEEILWGALMGLLLPLAEGKALERWGKLVNEPRGSLASDADYRAVIEARILANACTGDLDSIMRVMRVACGPVLCMEAFQLPPAAFQIQVIRDEFMGDARRLRVRRIMDICTPGGRDARYIELVAGGMAPPESCAAGALDGPLGREI